MDNKFVKLLVDASLHTLLVIVKLLLIPYNLWIKSMERLVAQKESGMLDLSKITGLWPLFSYLKRLCLEFFLDAISFLAYPVGLIYAFYCFFSTVGDSFELASVEFIGVVIGTYMYPMLMSLLRDSIQFCLLPIAKLIDWFKKPAQYLEIDQNNK